MQYLPYISNDYLPCLSSVYLLIHLAMSLLIKALRLKLRPQSDCKISRYLRNLKIKIIELQMRATFLVTR